jgi:hypothetical protein
MNFLVCYMAYLICIHKKGRKNNNFHVCVIYYVTKL